MRKQFLSIILACSMIMSMLALVNSATVSAATPSDGVTFSDNDMYYADARLPEVPYTYEMWLYIPSDVEPHSDGRLGSVLSNYAQYTKRPYFHVDVIKNGSSYMLRYEFFTLTYDASSGNLQKLTGSTFNFDASAAQFTFDEWIHFAIVADAPNNAIKLYKNGELVQTKSNVNFPAVALDGRIKNLPLVIGNDNRLGQIYNFKGKIGEIALYSDVRTESEVKADYLGDPDKNDKNSLAIWDFSSAQGKNVKDNGPFGIDLVYSKEWMDPSEVSLPADYAYSMIVVGDTQYMVEGDKNFGTAYTNQLYKWISDNAPLLKTQLVVGVGDVADDGLDAEYRIAYDAIKQMNGKVPYTLVRGNHDTYGEGNTSFNKYFAADATYMSQFTGENGGLYEQGSVHNSYYKFSAGGTDWLVLNLDWGISSAVVDWASRVVEENSDRKVIVVTHQYMMQDGTTIDRLDFNTGYSGSDLWKNLISKHDNIEMVLSGHVESNTIVMTQSEGKNGNTVSQFLIDGQDIDHRFVNTDKSAPAGLIAIFFFNEDGKTVDVRYYSPIRNQYYHTINQFTFDMESKEVTPSDTYNPFPVAPSGSGAETDPYIIKEAGNLYWMADQIVTSNTNVRYDGYAGAHLEGLYFKQVCDIDLGGLWIESIGFYSSTEYAASSAIDKIDMAAFGGHYDGNGYKIMNGTIVPKLSKRGSHGANGLWGDGLFGCIYGATIKNVTLENVTVWCENIAGGIVGRAMAPTDGKAPEDFNVISNCHLTDDCEIVVKHYYDSTKATHAKNAYDTIFAKGFVGSIAGIVQATTIENCSSAVEFDVFGYYSVVGGIVGAAGYNSVIDNCSFTGGVTLTDNTSKIMSSFGGIVGLISPNAKTTTLFSKDNMIGAIKITNCINRGYFEYSGTSDLTNEINIGGIVGHAPTLANGKTALIENCANYYSFKAPNASGELFIGGIVGKANTGSDYGPITVKNCLTVTVDATGGSGTNAYRHDDTTSASGTAAVVDDGCEDVTPPAGGEDGGEDVTPPAGGEDGKSDRSHVVL